jgi:hypothetical protein
MKRVIITGTSSGFGLKAAKEFADKGYKVFATIFTGLRDPQPAPCGVEGGGLGCQAAPHPSTTGSGHPLTRSVLHSVSWMPSIPPPSTPSSR